MDSSVQSLQVPTFSSRLKPRGVRLRHVHNSTSDVGNTSTSAFNVTSAAGYASSEGDTIKVYVRVRPPAKTLENDVDQSLCLEVTSANSLVLHSKPEPKIFSYDNVADMNTTQEEVFSTVGRKIIEGCVSGYNGTIFAYGQTGSGKTFTMLGPPDECDNFSQELKGVIPRGFEYMFSLMKREEEKHGDKMEFLCRCSFLEIYNEQIFDLLDPASVGLHLREDIKKGVFVEGLKEVIISSAKESHRVLSSGWVNRRVGSTSMNRESSRSHAVFTVSIESKEKKGGMSNIKLSQLHLVDLAGSERQKDTHSEGIRLKEAGSINKSLSALGNVIMALVDIAHGKTRYVHYRDSKLTFILRDSLGGNAKTCIIANIHPSAKCFGETLSTLNFARRAKMIKNKAVVNEDVTGNVAELQAEIRKLKELLSQGSVGIPREPSTQEPRPDADNILNVDYDDISPMDSPKSGKQQLNQSGSATQWKELMLNAISEREKSENEKQALAEKVQKLEELCSRKEKFLQSTKMIVKFRESHIKKLELKLKKEKGDEHVEDDSKCKEISTLKEEVKILEDKIEHHPDVTRFAMENLELRAEIKRLNSTDRKDAETSQSRDRGHRYTMQLERQLRDMLTVSRENDLEKSLSSSLQSLEASNAEIERLKHDCTQLQSKYDSSQQELLQNRQEVQKAREEFVGQAERFRLKELDLESELVASKRACMDVERALESYQLKTAVERTALNDIHMQTIKTLASPQKFGSPIKSTPRQRLNNNKSRGASARRNLLNVSIQNNSTTESPQFITQEKPLTTESPQFITDEKPLTPISENGLMRRDSLNDSEDEEEEEDMFFNFNSESMDAEEVYTEALMDELKKLQDLYNQLHQQIQGEESKRIKLNQINAKLQHQVNELNEMLNKEGEKWICAERDLNNQVTSYSDQLKVQQGEQSVLQSEVEDLRILIQSADKQLENFKRERNNDIIENGRKCASLESKLLKVETDFYNMESELDDTSQANQQLQSDIDNYQAELEFTRHKNVELEKIITKEREENQELNSRLQGTLEKLEIEIETNTKIMQQDREEEVFRAVEQTNDLRKELQEVNCKLEKQDKQILSMTKRLEDSNLEMASLKRNSASDKEAINNFRENVQELRISAAKKEADFANVRNQLEEARQMHKELTQSYDEKKRKIAKLSELLRLEKSEREKEAKQLREDLEQQEQQYVSLQDKDKKNCEYIERLQEKFHKLEQEDSEIISQYEIRVQELNEQIETKNISDILESQADELNNLKVQLNHFLKLSAEWEVYRTEKIGEIQMLKDKVLESNNFLQERDILEERIKLLEDDLESEKKQFIQKEQNLHNEINQLNSHLTEASHDKLKINRKMTTITQEKENLEKEIAFMTANLETAQEDVDDMLDELERTKTHEKKVFEEKESLKSQLSINQEEKANLIKNLAELKQKHDQLEMDNVKLVSHQNLNQKIHHHMTIKKENIQLKEENVKLHLKIEKLVKPSSEKPFIVINKEL